MFTTEQIITATELVKNFKKVNKQLEFDPEAILVTNKSSKHLVILPADVYENLIKRLFRYEHNIEEHVQF